MSKKAEYDGLLVAVELLSHAMEESTKSIQKEAMSIIFDSLQQSIQAMIETAKEAEESMIASLAASMSKIVVYANELLPKMQMDNLALIGAFEWCFYSVLPSADEELNGMKLMRKLSELIDIDDDPQQEEVDEYVSGFFPDTVIENIAIEAKKYLSEADQEKLDRAIWNYREERYYEAATLLVGLIDSHNIKQNLVNAESGGNQNVGSHGWKAFSIAFENNFMDRFEGKSFNGKGNSDKQKVRFQDFVDDVKQDWEENEILIPYVNLGYCLLQLFADSDWKTYPEIKKININRNWLMHGMYDLGDVTEIDCKKLFLILNRLAALYSTLPDCA